MTRRRRDRELESTARMSRTSEHLRWRWQRELKEACAEIFCYFSIGTNAKNAVSVERQKGKGGVILESDRAQQSVTARANHGESQAQERRRWF
jgi:hypothetical protein